jgi:hypothetical protein
MPVFYVTMLLVFVAVRGIVGDKVNVLQTHYREAKFQYAFELQPLYSLPPCAHYVANLGGVFSCY